MIWGQTKPPLGVKINHSHSLSKGIKSLWLFNEGYGDKVNDYSGNNYHAKITFPAGEITQWQGAKTGTGIKTEPTFTNVIVEKYIWEPSSFSVEGIIAPTLFGNYIPSLHSNISWPGWMLHGDANGNMYCGTDIATRWGPVSDFFKLNQFVHFVYTRDYSGVARLYKNGNLFLGPKIQTQASWALFWINSNASSIPSRQIIDKLSIYERTLSEKEVLQLYREPFAMFND